MEFTTPQGFRDVLADEARARELMARRVQDLFAQAGYSPIETPTLESMAVMQEGGRVPASPFKFFDAQGNLVTMRPDVTLQIARMCATRLGDAPGPFRFRYMQRVFRESEGQIGADAREKKQIGIDIDKKKLLLASPLKELGTAEVELKLHPQVTASLKVNVKEG